MPAVPELGRDLPSRILLHCTVLERLKAMQLSSVWRSAGDDPSSWATCDFGLMCEWNEGLTPQVVARAISRAGPALESLLRVVTQGGIRETLAHSLRSCHQLKNLDVSHFNVAPVDLLACLPPPPFKLQRLWLPPFDVVANHSTSTEKAFKQLLRRTSWVNLHECDLCESTFGIPVKELDDEKEVYDRSRRGAHSSALLRLRAFELHGPCSMNCHGRLRHNRRLFCGTCCKVCVHCKIVVCNQCMSGDHGFTCSSCEDFICYECSDSLVLRDEAEAIECYTCSKNTTCARCVSDHERDPMRRQCTECGEARCYGCAATNRFKNQPEPALRRCAGRCRREMCEKCAGKWHFVSGLGISTLRFCTGCYDALSDASASDEDY